MLFSETNPPTQSTLAELVAQTGAASFADADDASISFVANATDRLDLGHSSTVAVTVLAYHVTWTWHSQIRGPRPQTRTFIQVSQRGLSSGEGWAMWDQFICNGALTEQEAVIVGRLSASGSLPQLVSSGDA